jgi:hypothetical protein
MTPKYLTLSVALACALFSTAPAVVHADTAPAAHLPAAI